MQADHGHEMASDHHLSMAAGAWSARTDSRIASQLIAAAADTGDRDRAVPRRWARRRSSRTAAAARAAASCRMRLRASGRGAAATERERAERGDPAAEHEPATPAPIITCCWWRRSCERQSVSCTTSTRSFSSERPELLPVLLDRGPDLVGRSASASATQTSALRRSAPSRGSSSPRRSPSVGVGAPTRSLRHANRKAPTVDTSSRPRTRSAKPTQMLFTRRSAPTPP